MENAVLFTDSQDLALRPEIRNLATCAGAKHPPRFASSAPTLRTFVAHNL
jgi:hypothetical protein